MSFFAGLSKEQFERLRGIPLNSARVAGEKKPRKEVPKEIVERGTRYERSEEDLEIEDVPVTKKEPKVVKQSKPKVVKSEPEEDDDEEEQERPKKPTKAKAQPKPKVATKKEKVDGPTSNIAVKVSKTVAVSIKKKMDAGVEKIVIRYDPDVGADRAVLIRLPLTTEQAEKVNVSDANGNVCVLTLGEKQIATLLSSGALANFENQSNKKAKQVKTKKQEEDDSSHEDEPEEPKKSSKKVPKRDKEVTVVEEEIEKAPKKTKKDKESEKPVKQEKHKKTKEEKKSSDEAEETEVVVEDAKKKNKKPVKESDDESSYELESDDEQEGSK